MIRIPHEPGRPVAVLGLGKSGLTAALFGPVTSVVVGGIGTILVVLAVAKIWPEMRNLKTLDMPENEERFLPEIG